MYAEQRVDTLCQALLTLVANRRAQQPPAVRRTLGPEVREVAEDRRNTFALGPRVLAWDPPSGQVRLHLQTRGGGDSLFDARSEIAQAMRTWVARVASVARLGSDLQTPS